MGKEMRFFHFLRSRLGWLQMILVSKAVILNVLKKNENRLVLHHNCNKFEEMFLSSFYGSRTEW